MQTTHFGFREVPAQEKAPLVRGVFDAVATRYDVMNDLMSLGLHRLWKASLIDQLAPRPGMKLLDLAGGTGDIAFRALERAPVEVTLCDINAAMLAEGRNRAIDKGILPLPPRGGGREGGTIRWLCGNAESLPLPDAHFDACTIAFGIRNVTDIPRALREIHRVLKPGGRFLCLEFSPVKNAAYDWYSFHVIPRIGRLVAGDAAPYQYLVESIRRFPPPKRFAEMLHKAGFARATHRTLSGGAVAIHSGWKV